MNEVIGIGTGNLKGSDCYNAVILALKNGVRLIDTATMYGNEKEVGMAIKDSGIPRNEIIVISKVKFDVLTYEGVFSAFDQSCIDLQVSYIDIYLNHWPNGKERNAEIWRGLEELYKNKKVGAIGVSNFQKHHFYDLAETQTIMPMYNQVEIHPMLQQWQLQEYCNEKGVKLIAYGQFALGQVFESEILKEIAKKYNKSVAQVVLRWLYQRDIMSIPKMLNEHEIRENTNIFDFNLSENEIHNIKFVNTGRRLYSDPDNMIFDRGEMK